MRHRLFLPVAVAAAIVCMATYCADDYSDTLRFTNRSNIDVQVCYFYRNKDLSDNHIVNNIEGYEHGPSNERHVKAHSSIKDANITPSVFDELTTHYKTLSVYVLSEASTVSARSVICRYDLQAEDWDACCDLQFPPSPKMRNVNMEPSYEELTANAPSIHDLVTSPYEP